MLSVVTILAQACRRVGGWRRVAGALADLGWPRSCIHCERPAMDASDLGPARHLCGPCSRTLRLVVPPCCPICGYPLAGEDAVGRACEHCWELDPVFDEGRTLTLMEGAGRSLVHAIKYRGGLHLEGEVRRLARQSPGLESFLTGAVLVPVPLHPRRGRERGYNQSERIAQWIARECPASGARVERWLQRLRDTGTQTRLDRKARQANLKNAFALRRRGNLNPALHAVLIDDVFTTGATLNACAAVLRRAGCRRISVLTLAHG